MNPIDDDAPFAGGGIGAGIGDGIGAGTGAGAGRGDDALVLGGLELTSADLNGHTIDELADYYDAGQTPPDPTIDDSAGCQIALAAIARLRTLTAELAVDDAAGGSAVDEGWVSGILNQISLQARAGRDIPLEPGVAFGAGGAGESGEAGVAFGAGEPREPGWVGESGGASASGGAGSAGGPRGAAGPGEGGAGTVITEGAVRAIVRAAGDRVPAMIVGRCRFIGDVTLAGAAIVLDVDASVVWGHSIREATDALRLAILHDLALHTFLNVTAVNVTVHDVQAPEPLADVPPAPDLLDADVSPAPDVVADVSRLPDALADVPPVPDVPADVPPVPTVLDVPVPGMPPVPETPLEPGLEGDDHD